MKTGYTWALLASLTALAMGCAPINEVSDLRSTISGYKSELNSKEITYSEDCRCYQTADKTYILTEFGEKISSPEEFKEEKELYQKTKNRSPYSTGDKILTGITFTLAAPISIAYYVVGNIAGLPLAPWVYHMRHKFQKQSFIAYQHGDQFLKDNKYKDAREMFWIALDNAPRLAQTSDIYFKIAESYNREGNVKLAVLYYNRFQRYSLRLYPDYFEKYAAQYKNDMPALKEEFKKADLSVAKF